MAARYMTHATSRLTASNQDQVRNPMLKGVLCPGARTGANECVNLKSIFKDYILKTYIKQRTVASATMVTTINK